MPTRDGSGRQQSAADDAAQAANNDNVSTAETEARNASENDNTASNGNKKRYVTHWTCSKLQGDEEGSNDFGFPTLTPNDPVELNATQYEKANAAAILATGYRLREVND